MYKWLMALFFSIALAVPCIAVATTDRDSYDEFMKIHSRVFGRFVYTDQTQLAAPERFNYYSSLHPVIGDCDDFTSAVYYELWKRGYEPEAIAYDRVIDGKVEYRHAIVCADDVCFDNNYNTPYMRKEFEKYVETGDFKIIIAGHVGVGRLYDLEIYETIVWMASQAA